MKINTDIDLDTPSTFDPTKIFPEAIRAALFKDQKITPHPCGVYFQAVPKDPITGLAAVPYDQADELGCFKVDFLHLYVYDHFSSTEEIRELIKHDPDWDLLKIPSVVKQLFQLGKQFEIVDQVKPRSVEELADVLALIRPQKRFMLKLYLTNRPAARKELYKQDGDGYAFKKAHAIAYALVVVLQLHLIKGGITF